MRLLASVITILTLLVRVVSAQTPAPPIPFSNAFLRDDLAVVLSELRLAETSDPAAFAADDLDYLAGKLALAAGDHPAAAAYFLKTSTRPAELASLANFHLAGIARVSGGLLTERLLLEELTLYFPNNFASEAAGRRVTENLFESGDYRSTIRRIESRMLKAKPSGTMIDTSRADRLLLARALDAIGERTRSRQIIDELIRTDDQAAPDDVSLRAVRLLDSVKRDGGAVSELAPADHMTRGRVYQFNRDFAAARGHFLEIVNRYSEFDAAAEATYLIGRGYALERNFPDAMDWFERVAEQYPMDPIAKDALLQLGSAYARVGKARESVARYSRYIDSYPGDERLDRAFLNPIDVARDLGTDVEALRRLPCARRNHA